MPDTYRWRAHYSDGSILEEDDSVGFANIDQSRLALFELLGPQCVYVPIGDDGRRLIFFRRRQQHFDMAANKQWAGATRTIVGYQRTLRGRNIKSLAVCYDNGSILLTDDSDQV